MKETEKEKVAPGIRESGDHFCMSRVKRICGICRRKRIQDFNLLFLLKGRLPLPAFPFPREDAGKVSLVLKE